MQLALVETTNFASSVLRNHTMYVSFVFFSIIYASFGLIMLILSVVLKFGAAIYSSIYCGACNSLARWRRCAAPAMLDDTYINTFLSVSYL